MGKWIDYTQVSSVADDDTIMINGKNLATKQALLSELNQNLSDKVGWAKVENGQLKLYADSAMTSLLQTLTLPSGGSSSGSTTDTNTTYTFSISGNVITITASDGSTQTITVPTGSGSGSSTELFKITATVTMSSNRVTSPSFDKTFNEILTAFNSGLTPYIYCDDLPSNEFIFLNTHQAGTGGWFRFIAMNGSYTDDITIASNNTITWYHERTCAWIGNATTTYSGTMSPTDKSRLDTLTDSYIQSLVSGSGSSEKYRLIKHITVTEETSSVLVNRDENGQAFSLKKTLIFGTRIMPESGTQNWCNFKGTSDGNTPSYGTGVTIGGVGQSAGNAAGTARHFVSRSENITFDDDNINNIWLTTQLLSANETSANGSVTTTTAFSADIGNNNSRLTFSQYDNKPKAFNYIGLCTYSGACWGVGSEIYIMGVDA